MKISTLPLLVLFIAADGIFCYAQDDLQNMLNRYLDNYYKNKPGLKVYASTDKDLYELGESVWISLLATDRFSNLPLEQDESVDLKLYDPQNTEVWLRTVKLENGTGKASIPLYDYFSEGNYTLRVFPSGSKEQLYSRRLVIMRNVLPNFLVNAAFAEKYYAGGEKMTLAVSVTDYFKNPLKGMTVEYTVFNGARAEVIDKSKTDRSGTAVVTFALSNPLSKEGVSINLNIEGKGESEQLKIRVPIQSEQVEVFFFPEGGSFVRGLANEVTIKAYTDEGKDFPFSGIVFNEKGEKLGVIDSDSKGAAVYEYTPLNGEKLRLQITSPYVINKIFDFPEMIPAGAMLSLVGSEGGKVNFAISQSPSVEKTYYVSVINKGKIVETRKFTVKDELTFSTSSLKPGLNRITLFDQKMQPVSERMTYIPAGNQEKVRAEFTAERYNNREKVILNVNAPGNTIYTFAAVDKFRRLPSSGKSNLITYLSLDSEVKGDIFMDPGTMNTPPVSEINSRLSYNLSVDPWNEVYSVNNKDIEFQKNLEVPEFGPNPDEALYITEQQGQLVFSNFTQDVYYIANNPVLLEKLNEEKKTKKSEPFYKEQLRNGVPLRDVIHNMKPYTVVNNKIVFPGTMNSLIAQGGALIILDGVRLGENITSLDRINPFDIDKIFISTNPVDILNYTGLNSVGIIEITTKRGERPADDDEQKFDEEFQSPDYSKKVNIKQDLRTTIFYSPFEREASFPVNIVFYHSDVRTEVVGVLEGVDEHGEAFYEEANYSSFNYSEENQ